MEEFYSIEVNSDGYFKKIIHFLKEDLDFDLTSYREKYLNRRLYYRILKLDLPSYKSYFDYLQIHPEEPELFKKELTIHVTHFFRDKTPFRYIEKEILPQLADIRNEVDDKTINILCTPCSTGEEPYSLAIIAHFLQEKGLIKNPVKIHAYDIEPKVIEHAERGIYHEEQMLNISSISKLRNFIKMGEGYWKIQPFIKEKVTFGLQDLIKPFRSIKFDLISCRNFLIYIDKPKQQIVIDNLVKNLHKHGFLMLGKTEGFPLLSAKKFIPYNIREHLYKHKRF